MKIYNQSLRNVVHSLVKVFFAFKRTYFYVLFRFALRAELPPGVAFTKKKIEAARAK